MHSHDNSIWGIVSGSVTDTLLMLPVLFILYFILEYFSHKKQLDLIAGLKISTTMGPLAGSILGLIPQCGMSVFVTSLYLSGRVTTGTLLATYLATSDEAIPVMLAHGNQGGEILYLILLKFIIAVISGYALDIILKRRMYTGKHSNVQSSHVVEIDHELHSVNYREIILHSLKRAFRIYGWVLLVTLVISAVMNLTHAEHFFENVKDYGIWQITGAAVFGLIPNCAASIAIAELYIHSGLTLGAAVAGLSTGAGYGPIVLLKDGEVSKAVKLLLISLLISVIWGILIEYLAVLLK